jgi:hypothetical protein
MMECVIQSLWIGPTLSLVEQLCIRSHIYHGHRFVLYTYSDVKDVPEGVEIRDANDILDESKIFRTHNGSVAHFSDWFRWVMLFKVGGFWVDMDLIALKNFDENEELIFGNERYGKVNISCLKFPKGHFMAKYMADACENPNHILKYDPMRTRIKKILRYYVFGNKRSNVGWGEAGGPVGFRKALKHFNLGHIAKETPYFYPIPADSWRHIFDDFHQKFPSFLNDSFGIHLWNEHIRRNKKDNILSSCSNQSIFTVLLKKYM